MLIQWLISLGALGGLLFRSGFSRVRNSGGGDKEGTMGNLGLGYTSGV